MTGKRVVVVGGGDVAIDSARSAWRLGASEVHVVYRRVEEDMPAHKEEIEGAKEEGVVFHFLVNPVGVLGNDRVVGIRIQRQKQAEFDNSGRRVVRPIPGSDFDLGCDVIIPAIGQTTDFDWLKDDAIETDRLSTIKVGNAMETSRVGIFAAGDAVSGPLTVIHAVAQGNKAALAVDQWLRTGKMERVMYEPKRHDYPQVVNIEDYAQARRPTPIMLSSPLRKQALLRTAEQRAGNGFEEVETGLDEKMAQAEASRCLRCDLEWMERVGLPIPPGGHQISNSK